MTSLNEYEVVPPDQFSDYANKKVISSHCMIFARLSGVIPLGGENCSARGAVLMQLRFDGKLGFAGGLTDENECPVKAVNREMHEEINLDLSRHSVESKDHVISLYDTKGGSIHHFYALEVTESDFKTIEQRSLSADDYGDEVMGILRVPLYTRNDGVTGFPTFLTNTFAACSYHQLLAGLQSTKLLSEDEIKKAETIALKLKKC